MLSRLLIRDLAVVERAEIPFGPGLNAITGETGAGKTLVVQAVSLLVGERADPDAIREGASAAIVEGEFQLQGEIARRVGELLAEWGLEFDGETVIVRREVLAQGRTRATVNQSPVTQASLKRLGEMLADLHGQHEHQSLLRPEAGLLTLDRLAHLEAERGRYAEALAAWREASADLERLEGSLATFAERADYLRHAARELDAAKLVAGEEETLARDAARLAHADKLRQLVSTALERLSEGEGAAVESLGVAGRSLEQAAALDSSLEASLPAVREAEIATAEAARGLGGYLDGLEADPQALEEIEARRDLLSRLTHKYRRPIPELIAWRAELGAELATGDDASGALERARAAVETCASTCATAGKSLARRRTAAAAEWGPRLTRDLKPLGLPYAQLEFAVETAAAEPASFRPTGLDDVALRFTANPGEPAKALQKIASGGELSRVMLALKTALEAQDRVDLLLFDEVDSGIGGAVAQAVGERLRRLSRHRQIVCITHVPMIAALAEHHLKVEKRVTGSRTQARFETLAGSPRVDELARMLAGDRASDTTRRQARELLGEIPAKSGAR